MNAIEVLKSIGIEGVETIKGKVITTDLPHVGDIKALAPDIIRINAALESAGLLSKWRAKSGGAHNSEFWILIIGAK